MAVKEEAPTRSPAATGVKAAKGSPQAGPTYLLGAIDCPLALWAVLSVHAAAALGAPVASPEAAHTSMAPGGAGGCSGWALSGSLPLPGNQA